MAIRRLQRPVARVTMNLYEDDYRRMAELYPDIGAQVAIRELVATHVRDIDAKRARDVQELAEEIDL